MSDDNQTDYVKWFRHSSPYINAHRGKTFVVMLPGEALSHENFSNIIHDLALLASLGVRLVLVHGARPQIDARLASSNSPSQFHNKLRITDSASLSGVLQAIGEARITMEAALSTGLPNSPMHGSRIEVISGNFVSAMPHGVIDGVDLQHTGKVRRVNTQQLVRSLDAGAIALLSPLGYSATGEVFNLTYADVATHVAAALNADKLLAFCDADGVSDSQGSLIRQFTLNQCKQYFEQRGGQLPELVGLALQSAYLSCLQGVRRSQLVNFTRDGALLGELFTRDGMGTMVYSGHYEQLRSATIEDVGGILELIAPLESEGILVRRSRELLETEIDQFNVMEKDGTIIACASLYPYDDIAELACVATHPDYRKGGRAQALLEQLEQGARGRGIRRLFVLTTQTAHWFLEQGFVPGKIDELPMKKQSLYNYQRGSKIFFKDL
ncbi:amino-acid N-acetyltransferase [Gilvimarinus sp. SDUM040013]|uniref:Amino-acid acetyltransferase n=1 Tax=Gilvimarinus gilvus TaxID=3058038 RepID=A0ABU4RZ03_9GAMM|nr:amino-acid N-acetyltransferase [Gilvimarinus sp. SDUM040013]MDO3387412.1 amino-acid N-acetyltransferase [Gilvimarinus sp. SDUM040013]MDX6849889.1 amino-acid N-acetyltransferase [Gilvimarinus sp. SDUM040013]